MSWGFREFASRQLFRPLKHANTDRPCPWRAGSSRNQVTEFGCLGIEIALIGGVSVEDQGNALHDRHASLFQYRDLARIIGHQPESCDAEVFQHRLCDV